MNLGSHQLVYSMTNQVKKLDIVSNNLANVNTPGYKEQHLAEKSFYAYLAYDRFSLRRTRKIKDEYIKSVNIYPQEKQKYYNTEIGTLIKTDNNLDFAINDKNGFFKIKDNNGNIFYTKDGSFKIYNNKLVTKEGFSVLDKNSTEITINNGKLSSKVGVFELDTNLIDNIGNNNFKYYGGEKVSQIEALQGFLESSNADMMKNMVDLIEIQRDFERMQKAYTSIDDINSKLIEKLGSN